MLRYETSKNAEKYTVRGQIYSIFPVLLNFNIWWHIVNMSTFLFIKHFVA
jgi:hypothetical protein